MKEFELAEEIAVAKPLTDLTVKLVGEDGNAFFILGRVRATLRKGGYPQEFIEQFTTEATAGDYDHLLQTVMKYVNVE